QPPPPRAGPAVDGLPGRRPGRAGALALDPPRAGAGGRSRAGVPGAAGRGGRGAGGAWMRKTFAETAATVLGDKAVDSVLLVAAWFRKYPTEKLKLIPPDLAMNR